MLIFVHTHDGAHILFYRRTCVNPVAASWPASPETTGASTDCVVQKGMVRNDFLVGWSPYRDACSNVLGGRNHILALNPGPRGGIYTVIRDNRSNVHNTNM